MPPQGFSPICLKMDMKDKTLFYFNYFINEDTVRNVYKVLQNLSTDKEQRKNRILWINSVGGNVSEYFPLLNLFKRYFDEVLGGPYLESLAFSLWLSFPLERRYVFDNVLALFHNGRVRLNDSTHNKNDLLFWSKRIKEEDAMFHRLMQKNLSDSKVLSDIENMALKESTFDCDDLRLYGLLDVEDDSDSHVIQQREILESNLIVL